MKTNIFIVDDSIAARSMLINILKSDDSIEIVGESGTGQGCIIMIDETNPDIIIIEADTGGGMSLIDVIKEIKKLKPEIKIILCTNSRNIDIVIPLTEAGVSYFINKPYKKAEILSSVRYVVNK